MKKFKVLNPAGLGLIPDRTYIFFETKNGYKCRISKDKYIGYPKMLIESNRKLFKRLRERIPNDKGQTILP